MSHRQGILCAVRKWLVAERQRVVTWGPEHFQAVRELDWERITALLSTLHVGSKAVVASKLQKCMLTSVNLTISILRI